MLQIISANRLTYGTVVYLTPANDWSEAIRDAAIFETKLDIAAALAVAQRDEARNFVLDCFAVPVQRTDSGVKSISLRDSIRALGPTIAYRPFALAS